MGISLLVILGTCLAAVSGKPLEVVSFEGYNKAIFLANKNGEACKQKPGCLGKVVEIVLKADIYLPKTPTPLATNAHLIITGGCKRQAGRCIIDGGFKYQIFPAGKGTPYPKGNPAKLELNNIIFQKGSGGVLVNVYATVTAQRCIFRNNINGVIMNVGFFGGAPIQTYINCRFLYNNGTVITSGNGKLGLATDGGVGFLVKRSIFKSNTGKIGASDDIFWNSGGAVSLAGKGISVFENTQFIDNTAQYGGGAVFADQTRVIFRGVSFSGNKALTGPGGAVLGQSGVYGNLTASFCSSTFDKNSAPKETYTNSLLFRPYSSPVPTNRVDVTFCDTKIPEGSVFTKEPYGSVTEGTGGKCIKNNCKVVIPL